jgi:hypothetical protein
MKAHKLEIMVIDFDELGAESVKTEIENARYPNDCVNPIVLDISTREIGEWYDGHPLNNNKTQKEFLDRLFVA